MYVEYILMNAARDTKACATAIVTSSDRRPSVSISAIRGPAFSTGAAAFSRSGRKLCLWKEKRASMPPNTTLRSAAGTTVSCLGPVKFEMVMEAGRM
jgi:hypothetical protein